MPRSSLPPLPSLLVAALAAAVLVGCDRDPAPGAWVARVGDRYLYAADLDSAIARTSPAGDPEAYRQQHIDQWVTRQLLLEEARRMRLDADPDVLARVDAARHQILVDALIDAYLDEMPETVAPQDLATYFERHQDRLALREPFVRVRVLASASADSADAARRALQQAMREGDVDAAWAGIAERFAIDATRAREVAATYYPESRIRATFPALAGTLGRLGPGQIAPVVRTDSASFLLQMVDRRAVGETPDMAWIEPELGRMVRIEARKQMIARQVQRLKNEALARDALVLRDE